MATLEDYSNLVGGAEPLSDKKKLIGKLDGLRPLLILCVVAIHVLDFYPKSNVAFVFYLRESILRSAVPIFFFISGFFFFQNIIDYSFDTYKKKFYSRINTLVIPYLIWNLVAFIFCVVTNNAIQSNQNLAVLNSLYVIKSIIWDAGGGMPVYYPFWFIKYLIIIVIFTPIIKPLIDKLGLFFPLGLLGVHLLMTLAEYPHFAIVPYFICFVLGAYYGIKPEQFKYLTQSAAMCILFIPTSIMDVWCRGYNNYEVIHLVNIIVEMICFIIIAFIVTSRIVRNLLNRLNQYTFIIFATHALFIPFYYRLTNMIVGTSSVASRITGCFLVFIIVVVTSCLVGFIMRRLVPAFYRISVGSRS